MKKLLVITIMSLCVIGITANSFATEKTKTTTLNATVSKFAEFRLISDKPLAYRSTTAMTFKTVDGTAPKGWYYNTLATLDGNGDPSDNKSDVGLGVKSNVKFNLSVKKNTDSLDGKIGYFVDKAYNWNGTSSVEVPGVVPGTGFAATTTWGTALAAPTNIFVGTAAYADFSMGVSFALVPGNLGVAAYSTTITYTMTATL